MSNVIELSEKNFSEKVLKKNGFSFVDFWAPWCGPCRMMAPVVEEISEEIQTVDFYKINTDENQNLSSEYRVSSIPCFILFKNGKAVASRVGGTSKEDLIDWINNQIKSAS